jgi:hypothetical protein
MLFTLKALFRRGLIGGYLTAATVLLLTLALCVTFPGFVGAQENEGTQETESEKTKEEILEYTTGGQSRESMANDSTASQWSFQVAYEFRDWRDDILPNGQPRPEGTNNFWQFRFVAPLSPERTGLPFPLLPRLTLRNEEAKNGTSGGGNAEIFVLGLPVDWGTGRWGIGPQINLPADSEQFGTTAWRFGLATAVLQRAMKDKMLFGFLVQQTWGETDPLRPDDIIAQPITIQPVFNYALPKGYYLNIGETALSYDWQADAWLVPVGIRFGKLFIKPESTWNLYMEYKTTVVYKDWPGSAIENSIRLNVSYTIPVK